MTPTIALKCRAMKQETSGQHLSTASEIRQKPMDSESGTQCIFPLPIRNDSEDDAAQLLLSMSNIVSNEIKNNESILDDEDDNCSKDDASRYSQASNQENLLTPRESLTPTQSNSCHFTWNRARAVSIDSPSHSSLVAPNVSSEGSPNSSGFTLGRPALISPNSTPIGRGRPVRRASLKLAQKAKRDHLNLPKMPQMPSMNVDVKEYRTKALEASLAKGTKVKTISRKKFSWKNYPGKSLLSLWFFAL